VRGELAGVAASLAAGYLLGGIPFAYLIARARGVDLRGVGSGNIGATNLGRALGKSRGLVCLVLDVAKGFLPVFLLAPAVAGWTGAGGERAVELASVAAGAGAVLGHVFTPYLALRGGKGVATSIGVFGALCHWWIGGPVALYVIVRKATGYVSAGSVALAATLPAAALGSRWGELASGWPVVAFAGAAGALILARHRSNIARLLRGEEHSAPDAVLRAQTPAERPADREGAG
jgi:glycerol-3-phosphate acyltransferase PlsY